MLGFACWYTRCAEFLYACCRSCLSNSLRCNASCYCAATFTATGSKNHRTNSVLTAITTASELRFGGDKEETDDLDGIPPLFEGEDVGSSAISIGKRQGSEKTILLRPRVGRRIYPPQFEHERDMNDQGCGQRKEQKFAAAPNVIMSGGCGCQCCGSENV